MKIKNQFIICIGVFSVILLVIAASVATTEQRVSQLDTQKEISSNIERGASNLNSIAIDYFLYQEDQKISNWQTTLSSLSSDASNLELNNPQLQTLVNRVDRDLQTLNESFADVVSYLQSASRNVSVRIDPAFQIRWSSMALQSQTLASDAVQLSRSLDDQAHQVNETNILLIVSLVSTFGALLVTIYLMVFRRTLKSVAELQKGINTIGSGNLEYLIETKRQDEITELSHSFNKMTANLKEVTASKTDLEQAQASLRASEQRWSTTLASIGDAVIATDLSGKITFMNGEAEELTGWKLSEASLKPVKEIFNIVNEQTRVDVEDPVIKVLEKGLVVGLANHTVLIRKDGTEIPIDDSGAPIKDKDGKTTGVVLIFRDITERKKTEEALKRANEELETRVQERTKMVLSERQRLYSILETLPAYVVLLDKDYRVPFANKVFRERFGESYGKRCYEYLFNLNSPCENCETYKVLKNNKSHHWEWTGPDCRDYDIYDFPFIEADGSTLILEMGIDITERKQAEKQIREVSVYSRSLIEASLDPLVTISVEGKITDVNQATELATGCSRQELIGSDFSDYFTEPEKAKIGYKQVFTEGFVRDYPLAIKHKSGKITYVLYNASVYRNKDGEIQGVFAGARDVTELRLAEEQAQEAAKKLKDSERLAAIGATAGMVGHDIRNPLQAITGDLYLAKTELAEIPESPEKNNTIESLQEIEKNIDYINKIVADLQDFARPLKPHMEEADIKQIIGQSLSKNGVPKNVKVSVKVDSDARKVLADSAYLNRIFSNLVTNAIQAMPNGGKLTIHTYKDKKTKDTVLTVQDTGVGIPENAKSKLFTPMFTTKSKGQGFGLAVIKRMTEALSGNVTFESEEGKGTKFTVRFPQNDKKKTDF
jgi:PAS domain S-box-containing protein